jgi:tetratricopeptide (TPR) repeat protein
VLVPLHRSRVHQIGAAVAALGLGAIGFLPLFGGPGYEAALAAGLCLPSAAAVVTALDLSRGEGTPFDGFLRGLAGGFGFALLGFVLTLLHGLRVGFCDLGEGAALFALGPGAGAVLGGAWGALAGVVAAGVERRRRRIGLAIVLSLVGPALGIAISLWRFVTSPMVFAFDPFFGYFAGPLYDTVIEPIARLESYRVGSALSLFAAGTLFFHLSRESGELGLVARQRGALVFAGALAAAGSFALTLEGDLLGHWSTTATIEHELERSLDTKRCKIVYAPSIQERDARILGRECDAHVHAIERYYETRGPERITVFVFESEAQKARLMGAASTYIAKPWRHEVYIQFARYPHPVLGHELAHVVAGSFGQGPFRVAGPLYGLIPDPGRIEGVATAATPSDDPDFTLEEWSRAMLDLGLLPPLSRVFQLTFLGESSSKAYTVAGAFISWLHDVHGADAVKRWYRGEDLRAVTGKDLGALEQDWRAALARIALPRQALETARARFDRPAIFARKCPHVVDRMLRQAGSELGYGDYKGARESFEKVLRLDSDSFPARLGLGTCAERAGDDAEARRRWGELSGDPKLHKLLALAAEEAIADLDLARGDAKSASESYRRIADSLADEDQLRALAVKANPGSELGREAIVRLLIGDPRHGRDFAEAAAALGRWSALEPDNGEPDYLLGRNFYSNGRYEAASQRLDEALRRKISLPRVQSEAVRMRLVVACALDDAKAARESYARWMALPDADAGARAAVARMAERCSVNE